MRKQLETITDFSTGSHSHFRWWPAAIETKSLCSGRKLWQTEPLLLKGKALSTTSKYTLWLRIWFHHSRQFMTTRSSVDAPASVRNCAGLKPAEASSAHRFSAKNTQVGCYFTTMDTEGWDAKRAQILLKIGCFEHEMWKARGPRRAGGQQSVPKSRYWTISGRTDHDQTQALKHWWEEQIWRKTRSLKDEGGEDWARTRSVVGHLGSNGTPIWQTGDDGQGIGVLRSGRRLNPAWTTQQVNNLSQNEPD